MAGRPRKVVDPEMVRKLSAIGCTQEDISGVLDIGRKTLNRRLNQPEYREAMERGKCQMRVSLRRHQMMLAENGNTTMLIWLGKQHLGQSDSMALTGAAGGPIAIDADPRERLAGLLDRIASRLQKPPSGKDN